MTKIKALRQFSHFHLGTVDSGEVKSISDSEAKALVGMGLAEIVEPDPEIIEPGADKEPEKQPAKTKK
jgi:hypothetical protein